MDEITEDESHDIEPSPNYEEMSPQQFAAAMAEQMRGTEEFIKDYVQNYLTDIDGRPYPTETVIGLLRDVGSICHAIAIGQVSHGVGRIADRLVQALELMDRAEVPPFGEVMDHMQDYLEVASLHGLSIDGYDLKKGKSQSYAEEVRSHNNIR